MSFQASQSGEEIDLFLQSGVFHQPISDLNVRKCLFDQNILVDQIYIKSIPSLFIQYKYKFNMKTLPIYACCIAVMYFLINPNKPLAQTPSDAIMMTNKQSCVGLIYENSSFDEYWEGTTLRSNGTIETVKRNMILPMIAIGLHDKINLIVAAPWVKTASSDPNGGKFEGAQGFQDLTLALKGELLKKPIGNGDFTIHSTLGFSTPISDYLSDYRPYSIGFGAPELSFRGIFQYRLQSGWYARGALAYLHRGQTEAERDYYYNNGSYYTSLMDVPSAWDYQLVAGRWMFDNDLRLELNFSGISSTSGDDVRPYNAPQPTNKVNSNHVGFFAQYYFDKPKGFGVLGYANQVVGGRNTGKSTIIGVGLTYIFQI